MKKILALILTVILCVGLSACQKPAGYWGAEIIVKDYGTIRVRLDDEAAPITVNNFKSLAENKFYDGLTFHRVEPGFVIQGGCPKGDGTGGLEETIRGEFSANGYDNPISHKRGVISMARVGLGYNNASTQFFIVQEDAPTLDGKYAAFGYVISGMDVVDAICENVKPSGDYGLVDKEKQPVIESIRIAWIPEDVE